MKKINFTLLLLLMFCTLPNVFAETIYQWRDEWGQLQYSKTPVPGSMVSELTELPVVQELNEQQKQAAMFRKLQEMRQSNLLRKKNVTIENNAKLQQLNMKNYCTQLNNMLMDVQLRNANNLFYIDQFSIFGHYNHFLENDFRKEIRKNCR